MILQDITQLGFKEKEARVYLALFEIGEASAQAVARKAEVNRATTYFYLAGLKRKGLVRETTRRGRKFFFACPPGELRKYLRRRRQLMVQLQKMLLKVSPELEHRFQRSEIKPKIKLFEGRQGVLSIYEDLLTVDAAKDGEIFIFSARQKVAERFPTLLADLDRRRAAQGIWVRTIYSRQIGEDLPDSGEDKKSLHTFVTISAQKFPFPGNVHIYQNKVAFIALQRQLIGVVIENRNVANTYRTIFRLAWRGASELMKRND